MASPTHEQSDEVDYSTLSEEISNFEIDQAQQNISTQETVMTNNDEDLAKRQHFDGAQLSEFHHHAVEEGEPSAGSAFHVVSHTDVQKDQIMIEQPDKNEQLDITSLDYEENRFSDGQRREESGKGGKLFSAHIVEQHTSQFEDLCENIVQEVPMSVEDENILLGISENKTVIEGINKVGTEVAEELLHASDDSDVFSSVRPQLLNEDLTTQMSDDKPISDFQFVKPTLMENNSKDPSVVGINADNDIESELGKKHPFHKPEEVFNIDEETRMGLDQTPIDPTMIETSFIYPTLPPKKLFHLDDTKDSEASDTETKMSALCDSEDIRLRNTISIDDATKDSAASDSNMETPTPTRKQHRASRDGLGINLLEVLEAGERVFTADNLFEYQWPQDGGEWHLLQEQVSEYLKVKSFKRKYPDLYRRTCDKEEKDFLRDKGVVTETQSDLGLTALRSEEVYDLMMKDYNSKYKEYISHLQEKQKKVIREKHKEYSFQAKLDKSKLDAYAKKAARSAAEFNASLMRDKKDERKAYFDLQTYTIHFPKSKFRTLPSQYTKVGAYPVALIPGQYQENYRKYSAEELKYYPVKTSLKDPPKMVKYIRPPPLGAKLPVSDKQKAHAVLDREESGGSSSKEDNIDEDSENTGTVETDNKENDGQTEALEITPSIKLEKKTKGALKRKSLKFGSPGLKKVGRPRTKDVEVDKSNNKAKQEGDEKGTTPDAKMPGKIHGLEKCRICKKRSTKEERKTNKLVKCAECGKIGHISCLDLTDELVAMIKTYPWQCMECKTCVECLDPYDEDKMMFCDRCDRGYHTFCIGLDALPTGLWECKSCEGCPKAPDKPKPSSTEGSQTVRSKKIAQVSAMELSSSVKDEPELVEEDISDLKDGAAHVSVGLEPVIAVSGEKEALDTEKDGIAPCETETPVKTELKSRKRNTDKLTPKFKDKVTPEPQSSKQDRIHGARQSRRLKIKEEEGEGKRKKDKKDKTLKKKKKKIKKTEDGEDEGSVKEDIIEGIETDSSKVMMEASPPDDLREIVSEGVDDSLINTFDKNDDGDKDMETTTSVSGEGHTQLSGAASVFESMDTSVLNMEDVSVHRTVDVSVSETGEIDLRPPHFEDFEFRAIKDENTTERGFSLTHSDTADVLGSETMNQAAQVHTGSAEEILKPSIDSGPQEIEHISLISSQQAGELFHLQVPTTSDSVFFNQEDSLGSQVSDAHIQLESLPPAAPSLPMEDPAQLEIPSQVPPPLVHSQPGLSVQQVTLPEAVPSPPHQGLHAELQTSHSLIPVPQQEVQAEDPDLIEAQQQTMLPPPTSQQIPPFPPSPVLGTDLDPEVHNNEVLPLPDGLSLPDQTQETSACLDTSVGDLNSSSDVVVSPPAESSGMDCPSTQTGLENENDMDVS